MVQQYHNPFKAPAPTEGESSPEPASMSNTVSPFGNPDDDTFEFDLTNVQGYIQVPAGWYTLRLADVTKEVSAKSGNNMWVFHFEIVGQADGTPTQYAGRTVKKFCALTDSAAGILADTLKALNAGAAGSVAKFSRRETINTLCYGEMVPGEYNGQPNTSLGKTAPYNPPGAKYNPSSPGIPVTR